MDNKGRARDFLKAVWGAQEGYGDKGVYGALPYKDWRGGGKEGDWSIPEPFVRPHTDFELPTLEDLYFCPFLFTGKRRKDDAALETRWLYADLDERDPRNTIWELQPTLAWESSPLRYQALWLLDRPINVELFDTLNRAIHQVTKSDPGTWGRYRVLRVPYSASYKRDRPWRVKLLRGYTKALYEHKVEDLLMHLHPYIEYNREKRTADRLPAKLPTLSAARREAQRKLPVSVRASLKRGPQTGDDRSRVLWKLHHIMASNELSAKSSFVLLKNSKWNKFARRSNGDWYLWKDIQQARAAAEAAEVKQNRRASKNGSDPNRKALRFNRLNIAMATPVEWAWHGRWVLGSLNLLVGAEGVGKGTLAAWMLSQWSLGRLPGHLQGKPVGVGIIGDEDSWGSTWAPRLHAMGADPQYVGQIDKPKGGYITMADDKEDIIEMVDEMGIRILYLDALLDNLGTHVDDWKAKEVRDALEPIRWLARQKNICVIGSLHPNKKAGATFRQLLSGSHAFNAVPRSSMFLTQDVFAEEEDTKRLLVRGKGNLGPLPPAVEFFIDSKKFSMGDRRFEVPVVTEVKRGDLISADDVLAKRRQTKTDLDNALELILAQANGKGVLISSVYEEIRKELNVSDRAVRSSAAKLGVVKSRERWRLP